MAASEREILEEIAVEIAGSPQGIENMTDEELIAFITE